MDSLFIWKMYINFFLSRLVGILIQNYEKKFSDRSRHKIDLIPHKCLLHLFGDDPLTHCVQRDVDTIL